MSHAQWARSTELQVWQAACLIVTSAETRRFKKHRKHVYQPDSVWWGSNCVHLLVFSRELTYSHQEPSWLYRTRLQERGYKHAGADWPISPPDELSSLIITVSHTSAHCAHCPVCVCVCVCGGLFNALQVGSCSRSGQIRAAHDFLLGGRERNIAFSLT